MLASVVEQSFRFDQPRRWIGPMHARMRQCTITVAIDAPPLDGIDCGTKP
jgi:hypothetical protein